MVEHLTSLPERGVGALSSVSHLSANVRPCHVYSGSMPSKQRIGQTITCNDGTNHSEWHSEHGIACTAHHINYVHLRKDALYIALETVLLKLYGKHAPGCALTQVNFDPIQEILYRKLGQT